MSVFELTDQLYSKRCLSKSAGGPTLLHCFPSYLSLLDALNFVYIEEKRLFQFKAITIIILSVPICDGPP